jgi:hypothetical protein
MRTGMCHDLESLGVGEVRAVRVRSVLLGYAIGRQASRAREGESAMLAPFHFHVSLHSLHGPRAMFLLIASQILLYR